MRWLICGLLVVAGTALADGPDKLTDGERSYLTTVVKCDFAMHCMPKGYAQSECNTVVNAKARWDQQKASGHEHVGWLERADIEACHAAAKTTDCSKYPNGFMQFLFDAGNTGCANFAAFTNHVGKYAPGTKH